MENAIAIGRKILKNDGFFIVNRLKYAVETKYLASIAFYGEKMLDFLLKIE